MFCQRWQLSSNSTISSFYNRLVYKSLLLRVSRLPAFSRYTPLLQRHVINEPNRTNKMLQNRGLSWQYSVVLNLRHLLHIYKCWFNADEHTKSWFKADLRTGIRSVAVLPKLRWRKEEVEGKSGGFLPEKSPRGMMGSVGRNSGVGDGSTS